MCFSADIKAKLSLELPASGLTFVRTLSVALWKCMLCRLWQMLACWLFGSFRDFLRFLLTHPETSLAASLAGRVSSCSKRFPPLLCTVTGSLLFKRLLLIQQAQDGVLETEFFHKVSTVSAFSRKAWSTGRFDFYSPLTN